VRLGLVNVFRYPAGYLGRLAAHPELAPPDFRAHHGPVQGEVFPDWPLALVGGERDRVALGLPPGHAAPSLDEIPAEVALVALFNPLCGECRREAGVMESLRAAVAADPGLVCRVALVGVGALCSRQSLARFRQELDLTFPLALDGPGGLMRELGHETLPVFYLLRRGPEWNWVVAWSGEGRLESDRVLAEVRRLLAPAAP